MEDEILINFFDISNTRQLDKAERYQNPAKIFYCL